MGFAFFRWRTITLQMFGPTAMGHDWRCSWCRDEWYAVQQRRRVFTFTHTIERGSD